MGLNLHFVNDDYVLKTYLIGFKFINDAHTGVNIANIVEQVLSKFGIKNICSMTSDHASNNYTCCEALKKSYKDITHIGCFAHMLNIIIQTGLLKNDRTISKIRDSINSINRSDSLLKNLYDIAQSKNEQYYALIMDICTRWNSTYLMLESYIKNELILKSLSATNILVSNEWDEIKLITKLIKPFYDITNLVSGTTYPTFAYSYALTLQIKNIINDIMVNDKYKDCAIIMQRKYVEYCSLMDDKYYIAMLLDPRFKNALLSSDEKIKYLVCFKNAYNLYKPNNVNPVVKTTKFDPFSFQISNDNEIDSYLNSPVIDKTCDPLLFWKTHKLQFPVLSLMVRDYFCIPATSVSCEQLFSKSGDIITKRRNNISSSIVEYCMCINSWYNN